MACRSASALREASAEAIRNHIVAPMALLVLDPIEFPDDEIAMLVVEGSRDGLLLHLERTQRAHLARRREYFFRQKTLNGDDSNIFLSEGEDDSGRGHHPLQSLGGHRELMIGIPGNDRYRGLLSITRRRNDPPFTELDRAKAAVIAPALRGALSSIAASNRALEADRNVEALARGSAHDGVLLLDSACHVRFAGGLAADLIDGLFTAAERVSCLGDKRLPLALMRRCQALAGQDADHQSAQFDLTGGDGLVVSINLRRINREVSPTAIAIFVGLTSRQTRAPLAQVLTGTGLTPRQIEIVAAVCGGMTNRQIATHFCISAFTVQSHVKAIFEKLGVHNRVGVLQAVVKLQSKH